MLQRWFEHSQLHRLTEQSKMQKNKKKKALFGIWPTDISSSYLYGQMVIP